MAKVSHVSRRPGNKPCPVNDTIVNRIERGLLGGWNKLILNSITTSQLSSYWFKFLFNLQYCVNIIFLSGFNIGWLLLRKRSYCLVKGRERSFSNIVKVATFVRYEMIDIKFALLGISCSKLTFQHAKPFAVVDSRLMQCCVVTTTLVWIWELNDNDW